MPGMNGLDRVVAATCALPVALVPTRIDQHIQPLTSAMTDARHDRSAILAAIPHY